MTSSHIPNALIDVLRHIEPGVDFQGTLPKIRTSMGKVYFAKIGHKSEQEQYTGEAESLKEIAIASPGLAPSIVSSGNADDGRPYLITEYKEIGHLTSKAGALLGKRLAMELHAHESTHGFGFAVPTFCGATKQPNGWYQSWEECFTALISNLLSLLQDNGHYKELCHKGEEIRVKVIPKLLGSLSIKPILLHGDLWSGNIGVDETTGQPFIFDPSSYFGHNEADNYKNVRWSPSVVL
ncbi:hypothetical protein AX17_000003 [Amanita inopinata Kibby_2008]|nr:hypothetical protein AX17_000003 [Amanita inopinata Kibby_2008]